MRRHSLMFSCLRAGLCLGLRKKLSETLRVSRHLWRWWVCRCQQSRMFVTKEDAVVTKSQEEFYIVIFVFRDFVFISFSLKESTNNSSIDKTETSLDWQECFAQLQDTTGALHCHIHLPVCSWIMDPHSRAPKKNKSHGNEVLPQDTTHLIQRPCHQRGGPCQDPAGNWTTWRSLDAVSYTHLTLPTMAHV